jgi:phosphate-selective porin
MKTKIVILFSIVFALQFNTTFAQGCEDEAPAAGATGVPSTSSSTVFGYLQPEYVSRFTDQAESTFTFKRARIGVRGRANRSFSYYFVLETSAFIGGGDAYLLDAFVTYDKHEWAKVSLGSFKTPLSRDVATPCHALMTIDRSIVADQLVAPQRDMGLMLLGGSNQTKFRYSVALLNGRGLGINDNNEKKDVAGRATYQFLDFLNVGASFRYGYPNNQDDTRTSYAIDALLTYNDLIVQGEYIYDEGDYNRAAGGGCGAEPLELGEKRAGAYVQAAYNVNEKFQPVLKYEYFDQDLDQKKIGYTERMTVGVNYFFNKSTRLQINYQANIETHVNIDNDALLMQMQIRF